MVSEETIQEVFRYFNEINGTTRELTELYRQRIIDGVEYRIKKDDITEEEIIFTLIRDKVMEKYEYTIGKEVFAEALKFYNMNVPKDDPDCIKATEIYNDLSKIKKP